MLVHVMRHGETEGGARYWGITDVALSKQGWQQMHAAVSGHAWDLIVSSPLRRCAAFAEVLAQKPGARLRYEADMREMCFGTWEGRSAAELIQTDAEPLRRFWFDPSVYTPPGGESAEELKRRVTTAWQRIVSDRGRTLVVTHGGPIRVLTAVQLGKPLSALLSLHVPHAALFAIPTSAERSAVQFYDASGLAK